MKYAWEDLPKKLTTFTVRNATLRNLNTGKIVQNYSSNTRIDVVQKCVTDKGTYYRTSTAEYNNLNHAFSALDLGLPNENASSVPKDSSNSKEKVLATNSKTPLKTKRVPKKSAPKDEEASRRGFKKLVLGFFHKKK